MAKKKIETSNVHKFTIRNHIDGKLMTGAATQLLIDGKKPLGVKSFSLKVEAGGVATANVEYYGQFDVEGVGQVSQIGDLQPIFIQDLIKAKKEIEKYLAEFRKELD